MPGRRRCAALLAGLLALTGCAANGGDPVDAEPAAYHGTEPQPVPERPSFVLRDTAGDRYDFRAETAGKPTFLYFGYTSCPDECPTAMADVATALRLADAQGRDAVEVVFVTTDPERDTPEVLRSWLDRFGADVVGLVGTEQEVRAAQTAAGIRPAMRGGPIPTLPGRPDEHPHTPGTAPHDHAGPLGYAVDHTNMIFAFDVDDTLAVLYPAGVLPADIAADLPRLSGAATRQED